LLVLSSPVSAVQKLQKSNTFFSREVDIINNKINPHWRAGVNEVFEQKSLIEIKKLMGFKKNPNAPVLSTVNAVTAVPAAFDARSQWANCTSIGTIQNQAECGSCWAFGAVEAITDRFCIHKQFTSQLSFQDMVSCDNGDGGCEGGDATSAWMYAKNIGLVTSECYPYTIPTCPPAQQPCLNFVKTPKCTKQCNNSINWDSDKHKVSTVYGVKSSVASIQTEIYTNGPVEACFSVYSDFLSYKTGVYHHVHGGYLGGHCVKLLGWGTDSGVDYWLAANSWTSTWGAQGYFKIQRGTDECGIEDDIVAGMP